MKDSNLEDLLPEIPKKYILQVSTNAAGQNLICAVHIHWLRSVISERKLPSEFLKHETLTDDQIFAFINQGKPQPLGPFWAFIYVKVYYMSKETKLFKNLKQESLKATIPLTTAITLQSPSVIGQGSNPKTWPQIVDFIGEANFNYVWENPYISLLDLPNENGPHSLPETVEMAEDDYFENVLEILHVNHKCSNLESEKSVTPPTETAAELARFSISNLAQPLSIILNKNIGNSTAVILFYSYTEHTIEDCVNFSPQKLVASSVKQLFVLYQILQLIYDLELLDIHPGNMTLDDFWTDDCLYVIGVPVLSEVLKGLRVQPKQPVARAQDVEDFLSFTIERVKVGITLNENESQLSPALIESIIRHWCEGLISNYEYLMFLNYLAGRFCNINPNYHAVFPWVNDFSGRNGGWRDLTKSKFRLNKGERQLDLMFEEKGGSGTPIPHHVTDILSEITYYVYKARQTPKEVLCKFVRPKWVPAEYPVSIQRMQDWTPDECIPEFYDDPSIFTSIHPDLPDLLPPSWSSSPEEFIEQHRKLLESDQVSSKLHHWIDLTFGYKLNGVPAIKSKNVYLSVVDNHQNLTKHGIIQLFQSPHPPRRSPRRDLKNQVKFIDLKSMFNFLFTVQSLDNSVLRQISVKVIILKPHMYFDLKRSEFFRGVGQSINPEILNDRLSLWAAPYFTFYAFIKFDNSFSYAFQGMREGDVSHELDVLTLPRNYDPCGFLNDFEVCLKFFKIHFNNSAGIELKGIKAHHRLEKEGNAPYDGSPTSDYVKLFGCLMMELLLPLKLRYVSSKLRSISHRFEFYQNMLRNYEPLPIFMKRAIQGIFSRNESLSFAIPLEISIELLLLNKGLSPIPFPNYFPAVYKLVRSLRNYDTSLRTSDPTDLDFRSKVEELKVKSFARDLIQILKDLDEEGLDLVLPFVLELFNDQNTRVLAVWVLFCPFARAIGRAKAVKTLLLPIIQIYESDYNSDKHLKLFHRSFLLQLISCFGLEIFLENFATLLIEAIGGWKQLESTSTNLIPPHLKGIEDEIEETANRKQNDEKLNRSFTRTESAAYNSTSEPGGDCGIPEIFTMEPDFSDEDSGSAPAASSVASTRPNSASSALSASVASGLDLGQGQGELEPIESHFGSETSSVEARSIKFSSTQLDITEMCCESVMWLIHRLGPVLSAKYISRNLLRMLTLCYLGHLDAGRQNPGSTAEVSSSEEFSCIGDSHAEKVLDCLGSISDVYGHSFIERQYIPYCCDVVISGKKRMTLTLESALIGISSLLEHVLNSMEDALLVSLLNEPVIGSFLKPMLDLVTSFQTHFPSGSEPRALIVKKLVNMLNVIRRKIGPDISQQTLKPLILQLCARIQHISAENQDENKFQQNLEIAFGPWIASSIYTNFYAMVIGSEYEGMIRDMVLVQEHFATIPTKDGNTSWEKGNLHPKIEQQSTFGSRSFGNRIFVHESDSSEKGDLTAHSPVSPPKDTTRHLKGNWLVYWDHEVGRSASQFNFKQIKLQTFSGHTASIRSIWSLNNENSFLTGSKDKTCKIFSLRNQGDESTVASHKWTYTNHRRAVLSVIFNEGLHLAASTDGIIHIWDPFIGKVVRILEPVLGKNIRTLKPMANSANFVGAGVENFLTIVDPRTNQSYELKMGIGQNSGPVRCMSVSPGGDVVSVGHSSGMISSLDLRGTLMGCWKAHEGEVLQLINHNRHLISSSLDQHVSVWNLDDNKLLFNMRGSTEPVHSMSTFDSELLTCTTSNRIGVHNRIDPNSDFSSTRLRSDTFKGIVTTINLLPLNQLLLVGGDSGLISLLC